MIREGIVKATHLPLTAMPRTRIEDDEQIDRLLEDITSIREVINRNKPILNQLFNLAPFRWFMLTTGIIIIGFSFLFYFLVQHYGSYGAIPGTLKYSIYVALILSALIIQVWKGLAYSASAKRINKNLTLGWAFSTFYSNRIAHIYISHVVLMFFFTFLFIVRHMAFYIIPAFSFGMALIAISYGVMLHARYGLITGYWFLITGVLTILFKSIIPAPFAVILTIGCGMLIIAFYGFLASRVKEED
jgi:hypothetical protein